jgi:murein DD-endopeptidase MepM/ murein hydrolase activator NlpD
MRRIALLLVPLLAGCASVTPRELHTYSLPYPAGDTYTCVQPGPGLFSHSGSQRYAVDFALPEGTPVLAARAGKVVSVKEDSDARGLTRSHAEQGNHVRVMHQDRTLASYLHLRYQGAVVEEGETVVRGQLIGYSGHTGWSLAPHLHFQVDGWDPDTGAWASLPVPFEEIQGDGRPRLLGRYTSHNRPDPR